MHTLLFLEPGHFHAALTLRVKHPRVADEIFVYATEGPELRDFLGLVERFNGRAADPTGWQPRVSTDADPLARLIHARRGDVVVLAGKNGGKARTIHRLHDAGFHVLADKPWLVSADDLEHIRPSLAGPPLVMEIMTGRHDVAARLLARVVGVPDVVGALRDDGPAIELESTHCLEKLVDGVPLRRPWWFFDVRVQGSGAVDLPTHLVDQTQWLVESAGRPGSHVPRLLSARVWPTPVPGAAFRRITGEAAFPETLLSCVDGDGLSYRCNAELVYRVGDVTARAVPRWELSAPPGGGDSHRTTVHGARADVVFEQSARTGNRRRLVVEPRVDAGLVAGALTHAVATWHAEFPAVSVEPAGPDTYEVVIPAALQTGHETHFAQVLDAFLGLVDAHRWPAALAERTLAKYTLLAEAASA